MITMGDLPTAMQKMEAMTLAAAPNDFIRQPSLVAIRSAAIMNSQPPNAVRSTGATAAVPKKAAPSSSKLPLILGGLALAGVAAFVILRKRST